MKVAAPLCVRIPDWTDPANVAVTVNENPVEFTLDGDYVTLDTAAIADVVTVGYPQRDVETIDLCSGREYLVTWKGDFVAAVDPPGTVAPIFERDLSAAPEAGDDVTWPPLIPEVEW